MCSARQISAAVDACLSMMEGEFDLQTLQMNDTNFDWQFKAVENLAEEHGVSGLYVRDGVLVNVFFQAGLSEAETHLTIGHELGHHFLHRTIQLADRQMAELGMVEDVAGRQIVVDERREWEAETFGRLLLERAGRQGTGVETLQFPIVSSSLHLKEVSVCPNVKLSCQANMCVYN